MLSNCPVHKDELIIIYLISFAFYSVFIVHVLSVYLRNLARNLTFLDVEINWIEHALKLKYHKVKRFSFINQFILKLYCYKNHMPKKRKARIYFFLSIFSCVFSFALFFFLSHFFRHLNDNFVPFSLS